MAPAARAIAVRLRRSRRLPHDDPLTIACRLVGRGKASRDLGKPLDALEYFKFAEKSLKVEAVTPRWHALLDISRSQALCDAGNLTVGIDLAIQGFLLAHKCQSPRQMNRVRKLLRKLETGPQKDERKIAYLPLPTPTGVVLLVFSLPTDNRYRLHL